MARAGIGSQDHPRQPLHATSVAIDSRGILIRGASGTGKSALALSLMALGARLIADDRTLLTRSGTDVIASCPEPLRGLIEARGVGILHADAAPAMPVRLIVDLDHVETRRLPEQRTTDLLGLPLPVLQKVESPHFPAAILQYVKYGHLPE